MLEKIFIFALFLAPLIFFHELGHFFFARLFGVRVETFSIGFGPKLLKKKWKDTTYALSLIPLGGYVKMFGEDPTESSKIDESDKKYSFTHKGKMARFWIIFGGPLANILLAYFLFFILLMSGEKTPEIRFGAIDSNSVIYSVGVRSGDLLKSINSVEINSPTDITFPDSTIIESLGVERAKTLLTLTPKITIKQLFDELKNSPPLLRKPIFVDETGKKYILSNSEKIENPLSIEELAQSEGENVFYLFDFEDQNNQYIRKISLKIEGIDSFLTNMTELGFYPLDLVVKSITMGDPADVAGIRGGDIIIAMNDVKVNNFNILRNKIQNITDTIISITVLRNSKTIKFNLKPIEKNIDGNQMKLIGVLSSSEFQEIRFINTTSKGFFESLYLAIFRTYETVVKTLDGFAKLLTNQVSFKNVGGPIAIAKVASDSFSTSLSYFFQIMAIISVNLGLINLFPIPVLDGGHIIFIIIEAINRGRLSQRKMEIAQQVGLSLLLLLMFAAIFNDVTRLF